MSMHRPSEGETFPPSPDQPKLREHVLFQAISKKLTSIAPILCHVNADTSWCILIPFPLDNRPGDGRIYYKTLLDPWFTGPQVDYFVWFSIQHHVVPSAVQTVQELEAILCEIELEERRLSHCQDTIYDKDQTELQDDGNIRDASHLRSSPIDCVVISHEFSDHCHEATLRQLSPSTPIIAGTAPAAKLIRSWKHFDDSRIFIMPPFTSCISIESKSVNKRLSLGKGRGNANSSAMRLTQIDWAAMTYPSVPEWLSVSRLFTPRDVPQKGFHAGVMLAFRSPAQDIARAIIYSPHGLTPAAVVPITERKTFPRLEPLALLHGRVKINLAGGLMPLNLGGGQGGRVAQNLGVPYWFGTHEENKKAAGGVAYLLHRKTINVERNGDSSQAEFSELGSGEVAVLM